jgi:hypothetical protein
MAEAPVKNYANAVLNLALLFNDLNICCCQGQIS